MKTEMLILFVDRMLIPLCLMTNHFKNQREKIAMWCNADARSEVQAMIDNGGIVIPKLGEFI